MRVIEPSDLLLNPFVLWRMFGGVFEFAADTITDFSSGGLRESDDENVADGNPLRLVEENAKAAFDERAGFARASAGNDEGVTFRCDGG